EIARRQLYLLEHSFLPGSKGAAGRFGKTGGGAARSAGRTDEKTAWGHSGDVAAAIEGGCGVYTRDDHAPRASRGDDGADCFAYGKQRITSTGSANQQFANGRD